MVSEVFLFISPRYFETRPLEQLSTMRQTKIICMHDQTLYPPD